MDIYIVAVVTTFMSRLDQALAALSQVSFAPRRDIMLGVKRPRGIRKTKRTTKRQRLVAAPRFRGVAGENKFQDLEVTDHALTAGWTAVNPATVDCISAVAQGDGESQRDGRVYHINSLHLRGLVKIPTAESAGAPQADDLVRVCVIWDTQTNQTEVVATEVMDGGQTDDVLAFRNLAFSHRFRVLFDKTIHIKPFILNEGAANLFANQRTLVPWKFDINFRKPIKVVCSGTGAVVTDMTDNSMAVIACAQSTAYTLSYQVRVRFSG